MFEGKVVADDRGTVKFVNDFNFEGVRRFYMVENHRRGYIRAWHGHKKEGKYIFVPSGAALIGAVALDTRTIPPEKFILCEEIPKVLWIPPGYANGAMTLREGTKIIYFSTATLEETKGDDERFPYDTWDIWTEDYR
jgi:dTDP-4-dehydrorhamnose 3,5-epimerase